MRCRCGAAPSGACASAPAAGSALSSSTSCDACQKKRYGLMVVPKTATTTVRYSAVSAKCGETVWAATSCHQLQGVGGTDAIQGLAQYRRSVRIATDGFV